jgi:L-idonate 5-dehydrogenase
MKALKIHGAENMTVEEIPVPEPGKGEVRVRMQYGGICGSDLHYYFQGKNGEFQVLEPFTPGHEMSGVVDVDPSGKLAPGTPVTIAPATFGEPQPGIEDRPYLWPGGTYLGSASTNPHTQGGMAEYRLVKDFMIRVLPEGLSTETASLAEPMAVALHAIRLAGGVQGKKVLVSGSGPIGLCVAASAVAKGAAEVTASDVLQGPLDRAKAVGAEHTINVATDPMPVMAYDLVFECSGVAVAISPALAAVRRAGTVVQVGMLPNEKVGINLAPFVSKEVTYLGSFRFDDEIDEAIELLADYPRFASVITHVVPVDQVVEAFEIARDSQASGKVVVSLWLDA